MLSDAFATLLSTLYIVAKGEMTHDKQFFFCHNVFNSMTVYVEKQPVAWKAKKHMSRWAGRDDMTEKLFKMVLTPINQLYFYHIFN